MGAKTITLPSRLTPASIKSDANIPANANMSISGQDITCSYINLEDVKTTLGETGGLYDCYRSIYLNKWAAYRPGTWRNNGSGGSVWLPSNNDAPNFTLQFSATANLTDFALYSQSENRKPTHYDWHNVQDTIFEEGDTGELTIQLKRGYRNPVCQDTGALGTAWEKIITYWTSSDTPTGAETMVVNSPPTGTDTIPELPSYLEHKSGSLSLFVGYDKYIHCRPYYISGVSTKISMIEDGQKLAHITCVGLRCTGVINSATVNKVHVINKTATINWSVTRNSGAPTKSVEFNIRCRSAYDSVPTDSEFTSGSTPNTVLLTDHVTYGTGGTVWPNTMVVGVSMSSNDVETQTTTVSFGATTNTPTTGNNYAELWARLEDSPTWQFLGSIQITWIYP